MGYSLPRLEEFDFSPGRILSRKYKVINKIGDGWEGEVYLVEELHTGIQKAAKFFYPHRNPKNKHLVQYAKKLHKLRHCDIITHYLTQEHMYYLGHDITYLISEYVEGERFDQFLKSQQGKRLPAFTALHFLYALAKGFEKIHSAGGFHGDLHAENIIIQRYGLGFQLKLIDMAIWETEKRPNVQEDICDMIILFYNALGGQKHYSKQPKVIKEIICGLKRTLILKKFRSAAQLRKKLEQLQWS